MSGVVCLLVDSLSVVSVWTLWGWRWWGVIDCMSKNIFMNELIIPNL